VKLVTREFARFDNNDSEPKAQVERNPFSAQNQTLRSYRIDISPTK